MNCILFARKDIVKKKNGLNKKDKNKFYYKTLRLADDYEYECEEE